MQDQNPQKIVSLIKAFVRKKNPDVKVDLFGTAVPYRSATTGPLADAIKSAVKFAFGREPVFVRGGGTIGAVVSMEKVLQCPVMFLGCHFQSTDTAHRMRTSTGNKHQEAL